MTRSILILKSALFATLFFLTAGAASAQYVPFLALDPGAINTARALAIDSIGAGAQLGGILWIDQVTLNIFGFKTANGMSDVWFYIFFAPNLRALTIAVLDVGGKFMAKPADTTHATNYADSIIVNTSGAFANSDKLAAALSTNSDFQKYKSDLPDAPPALISLQSASAWSGTLPASFPTNMPVWNFTAGNGSTVDLLSCFTSAGTGETVCQRFAVASSVKEPLASTATIGLTVAPNPADGMTRITPLTIEGVNIDKGSDIALYNSLGSRVLDLSDVFARNNYQFAEFDSKSLPAGAYYCRAQGRNWSGTIGVIVTH